MMKTVVVIACIVLMLFGVYAALQQVKAPGSEVAAREARIELRSDGFSPAEVRIVRGGAVTFTSVIEKQFWPASNLHPSHSIYSEFDPKRPLQPDESWSFIFEKAGDWGFHDHLRSYFTGVIHVVE